MVLQRAGIVQAAQARPERPQFDHVDRGRADGQTLEVVQRDAGIVRHDQFDHIAVRKSDDGVFGMLRPRSSRWRLRRGSASRGTIRRREIERRWARPARSSIPSCWTGPSAFAPASRRISLRPDRSLCESAGCALWPAAAPFRACVPAGWSRSRRPRWRLSRSGSSSACFRPRSFRCTSGSHPASFLSAQSVWP